MTHDRNAAALLEKAARLALASEHNKAIRTMDLALTELQKGFYAAYATAHHVPQGEQ